MLPDICTQANPARSVEAQRRPHDLDEHSQAATMSPEGESADDGAAIVRSRHAIALIWERSATRIRDLGNSNAMGLRKSLRNVVLSDNRIGHELDGLI